MDRLHIRRALQAIEDMERESDFRFLGDPVAYVPFGPIGDEHDLAAATSRIRLRSAYWADTGGRPQRIPLIMDRASGPGSRRVKVAGGRLIQTPSGRMISGPQGGTSSYVWLHNS